MVTCADGSAQSRCRTHYGAAGMEIPGAANDNGADRSSFTFLSSTDASGSESRGTARNLQPTDLFDDLTEIDGAFRASVPLCVLRASGRQDK